MFQRQELSLKIYFVIVFIVFSRITTCREMIMYAVIGKQAQLDFSYPCDSTKVTLQHANAHPFYNSNNPSSVLDPPNYRVDNQHDTASDNCSLHLTINPVSRDDEGTYILIPSKNGVTLQAYLRIYVGLGHPPGKASCQISNDYDYDNDGEWVSLQCTAPVGTLKGHIVCYQNGMKLPKYIESGGNLNQIVLARLDNVVYCCSSVLTEMKDKCDCTDWGWDPMSDSVSDIAEPCPQVMSTHLPTSTHNIIADKMNYSSSNLVTVLTKHPENHKYTSYWIVFCAFMVILVVIIIALIIKYHRTVRELEHLISSIKPESKDPCLPVTGEEVV